MYRDAHSRRGSTRKANNGAFYAKAIEVVLAGGFVPAGETTTQTVRIPTTRSPVYGGAGGEIATFGGRQRFTKPDTDMRVTVGKITTYFYEVEKGETKGGISINTRETERIRKWAATAICFHRHKAIALGRGDEWLRLNAGLIEAV
jgi:hypothetical protein